MSANDTTYNGWTNRETWLVNLWLDNDGVFEEYGREWCRDNNSEYDLGQAVRGFVEDATPEVSGLYADIISGALSAVNWYEIAEHVRESYGETEDED